MIVKEIRNGQMCTSYAEPTFERGYDLVVIGLGTAGAISLIAAGREGLKVLGVEQLYGMGGVGTVGAICWYYFGALGGIYTEVDEKAVALEQALFAQNSRMNSKGLVLEREAKACGAETMYHTIVTGVYMEANEIKGLRLFREGREINVAAKTFIDATGEAHVCHMAGGESFAGRESDGQTQPFTFTSICVNKEGFSVGINHDSGFINQHNPLEIGEAFVRTNNFPMYLKADYSKDEQKFVAISPLIGVREGRRIKGRKQLKFKDVVNQKLHVDKPLFYTFSNVDNHGKDIAFEDDDMCDWMVASGLWGVLISIPVPLDALRPEGIDNILAAGRCISMDHNLTPGIRMMRDMAKCGEAAAVVCAEAVKSGKSFSGVDYEKVAGRLRKTGCLDEKNNIGFMERVYRQYYGEKLPQINSSTEISKWLASDKPGWGIWSARNLAENDLEVLPVLREYLNSNDENLCRNTALALGLMREKCAAPKLRQIAKEMDNYIPASSLKYVYTRGVSAIYLLGKLQDTEAVELLLDIVKKRGTSDLEHFTYGEFYGNADDVASQYILYASRALVDIAKANPDRKKEIKKELLAILRKQDYNMRISFKANSISLYDLKPKLIEYISKYLDG